MVLVGLSVGLVDGEVGEVFVVSEEDGTTGVDFTVFDELGIVGSISCFQSDTRWTHGAVVGGEFVVVPNDGSGRVRLGGIAAMYPIWLIATPTIAPSPSAIGPHIAAHFLMNRLSVSDRNGAFGTRWDGR